MIKKLKRIEVEEKLKSLGLVVFTPREFQGFFGVSAGTASVFISNNVKSGLFLKLRNGYYMVKDSRPSHYYIANKLYQPSYISLAKALSHYNIIPEVVYAITSVTTKTPREFDTPIGVFSYQKIKKEAFTGYRLTELDGVRFLLAEPEKAMADYLYFVDLKKASLNDRLELRNINKNKLIKYVRLFKRSRMLKLIDQVYAHYRKSRKIY